MNIKRFSLATLVGFGFIFSFQFLFHGNLLKETYEATAHLWRSEMEMKDYCSIAMIAQLLITLTLAFIFTRNYEGKGIGEGIRFGLMFGILIGIGQFSMYAYMPIPMSLALAWFGGTVIEKIGLGIIFSLLYKK